MIYLKLITGFIKKFWLPVLIFAFIAAIGLKWHGMTMQIAGLESQNLELSLANKSLERQRDNFIKEIQTQNLAISHYAQAAREFEMEVDRLNNRTPEKVIEYRETIKEVERNINSPACETAIAQAAEILRRAKND